MKWIWITAGVVVLIGLVALAGSFLPKEHHVTRRARLRQRPETVYAVLAGPPDWRSDVKAYGSLADKKWWEQDSHGQKIAYELVEESPPARRVVRIADPSLPFGGTWTLEIEGSGDGTRIRVTEDGLIRNVIFRFMARYIFGYTTTIERYLHDLGRKFGETVEIEA